MTAETATGERKGPASKQDLFVAAYTSAAFFNRLRELGTHLLLNSEDTSLRSFLIWDDNKRGELDPLKLKFIDSEKIHSGEFLEPTRFDLELLRRIAETGDPAGEADLVITRATKDKPDIEILIIQEGRNFKGYSKRNSAEQIPGWFRPDDRLKVGFVKLVNKGFYQILALFVPKDRRFFDDWQKRLIAKLHT